MSKTGLSIGDIKQTIHNIDMIRRPYVAFLNPDDAAAVKEALPAIEDKLLIEESKEIERGKGIVIERKKLENAFLHFEPKVIE